MNRFVFVALLIAFLVACQETNTPPTLEGPARTARAVREYTRLIDLESTHLEKMPAEAQRYAAEAWQVIQRECSDSVQARYAAHLILMYVDFPIVEDSLYIAWGLDKKMDEWRARYPFMRTFWTYLDYYPYQAEFSTQSDSADFFAARVEAELTQNPDWELEVLFAYGRLGDLEYRDFQRARKEANRLDSLLALGADKWLSGDRVGILSSYIIYFSNVNIHNVRKEEGDLERAAAKMVEAKRVLEYSTSFDSLLSYNSDCMLAWLASAKGDCAKELEIYKNSLPNIPRTSPHALVDNYNFVGMVYMELHQPRQALQSFRRALELIDSLPLTDKARKTRLESVYCVLVGALLATGDTTGAEDALQKTIIYASPNDESDVQVAQLRFWLATQQHQKLLALRQKKLAQSQVIYGAQSPQVAAYHASLANLYLKLGEPQNALAQAQLGLVCAAPGFVDSVNFSKNPTFDQISNQASALSLLQQKATALRRLDSLGTLVIQSELADLALQCLEARLRILERENSKSEFVRNAFAVYELGIGAAFAQYQQSQNAEHLERAFAIAERSKSILLGQALQEENAAQFAGLPDSLIQTEKRLEIDIAFYEQEAQKSTLENKPDKKRIAERYAFQFRQQLDSLKQALERNYPKYYALKYQPTMASVQSVRQALDAETVFVEMFEGERAVYVFSITTQGADFKAYPRPENYTERLRNYRRALSDLRFVRDQPEQSYQQLTETGAELYETYLAPSLPASAKKLIFVADGAWNYIPLEALPVSRDWAKAPDFRTIPYLVQRLTVRYDYSAGLWMERLKKQQTPVNSRILAFAPSYDLAPNKMATQERRVLAPLVATQKEVAFLQNNFDGAFYTGAEANEATFKANAADFGILHFAMHGLVDEDNPQFSSLAFTEVAGKEDDLLRANEIKTLEIRPALVVLSACETGIGKYQHGEGVMSLGRSFMYAGAPSVVMTLWSINDQSSQMLVQLFYQYLAQGLPKDAALRQAKLDYLERGNGLAAHPMFWAAFVQLGDNQPVAMKNSTQWWIWLAAGALALGVAAWVLRRKAER